VEQFEKFLKRVRKRNGDKLLPVTIEKYVYFVSFYYNDFLELEHDKLKLIEFMNTIVKQRPSIVIYSSFRMYLLFLGIDKKDELLRKLEVPPKSATAFSSKRYLESKVLSRGELQRLFNEVDDETKLIFSFLYDTACRRSEMLGVKWGDITFKDKKRMENKKIYGEVNILGKGAKSRIVYIGKTTYDLIRLLRGEMEDEEKVFMFYSDGKKKRPLKKQADALYNLIRKTCKKILGRHITPHCFRHTKLTHLADAGADVLGISRYAGHEDVKTSTIYIEMSNRIGRLTFENFSQEIVEVEV